MVRPKKHLGQHFLIDETIAKNIVEGLQGVKSMKLYEVGPGTGVLTKYLIEDYEDFLALDVDQESVDFLKRNYPNHSSKFQYQDFLQLQLGEEPLAVIGNFPYNISSQLFFKIWESNLVVDEVVCMVQKEVAERISAKHGNKTYGILSVLLQAFYNIEYLFTVPPEAFNPPPKVQSGVIRLKRNNVTDLGCDVKLLKMVVKTAFGQRRKTLRNALKSLNLPEEIVGTREFTLRAEQLSVDPFIQLTISIEKWKHSAHSS